MATSVAVFGSSEVSREEPAWREAQEVGRLLARAGFRVVSGGYGGVMEAASQGATEGGGKALGITCAAFGRGPGNRYLTEERLEPDLFGRTRALIEICDAYIILAGKAGTLAELAFLWALHRGGLLGRKPVVLLGGFWSGFVDDLIRRGLLDDTQAAMTAFAPTPEDAVEIVRRQVTPR